MVLPVSWILSFISSKNSKSSESLRGAALCAGSTPHANGCAQSSLVFFARFALYSVSRTSRVHLSKSWKLSDHKKKERGYFASQLATEIDGLTRELDTLLYQLEELEEF